MACLPLHPWETKGVEGRNSRYHYAGKSFGETVICLVKWNLRKWQTQNECRFLQKYEAGFPRYAHHVHLQARQIEKNMEENRKA